MIIELLTIAFLSGYCSNEYGRVGVRVGPGGKVHHVYKHSPASGLLYKDDVIIEADGHKGHEYCTGTAGVEIMIKVRRLKEVKTFVIKRVPKREVYD